MDMADAAEVLGLLDLAIWTLEQARQKNPRDPRVNRSLARLYEKRGNFTHAIALWELVSKADPSDAEAHDKARNLAASETIARGHYEEALGGKSPLQAARREGRGAPIEDRGSKAEDAAEPRGGAEAPSATFDPTDRVAREAAPLRARLAADPTNANTYLHLASLYRRADRVDEAREVLRQGLGPTGNHFELSIELADLEIEPFRQNLAIAEEKLRTDAQNEELRKIRIRLLKEINVRELDLYRQKADRYPTEMAHRFEVGVRLLRAGQVDEAIRELQAARADPRHHWRSLLYLGFCFKSRHNWRLAQRNFQEALQELPAGEEETRKEILFQLAQGSAEAGDLAAAVDLAHELANIDFAYRDIGQLLDDWQARLHQANVSPG
jgi:tetratricopeptide (TPR) repeat protein